MDILRPHLINSDILLLLPDWQNSKGANLEREWAEHYKKQIVEYTQLHDVLLYPVICDTIKHGMMKAGVYKECPNCGEKFKETDR